MPRGIAAHSADELSFESAPSRKPATVLGRYTTIVSFYELYIDAALFSLADICAVFFSLLEERDF